MSPILSVSTKIEIAASPAAVRSVVRKDLPLSMAIIMIESPCVLNVCLQFLDFARYTQWKPGWIIQPVDASKQPLDLKPGDGLKVSMDGKAHNPVVVVGLNVTGNWNDEQ